MFVKSWLEKSMVIKDPQLLEAVMDYGKKEIVIWGCIN